MAISSSRDGPTLPLHPRQRTIAAPTLSLLFGWAIALLLLCAVYLLARATGDPLGHLTRDPAAITQSRPYIGLLSMVGVMLWAAAVAVSLLGVAAIGQRAVRGQRQAILFLTASAAFSLILGIDDTLMLHEQIFPNRFNWPETTTYLAYILAMATYIIQFRQQISSGLRLALGATCLCWGISIGIDSVLPDGDWITFIEDGFKFVGIVNWLVYCSHSSLGLIRQRFSLA